MITTQDHSAALARHYAAMHVKHTHKYTVVEKHVGEVIGEQIVRPCIDAIAQFFQKAFSTVDDILTLPHFPVAAAEEHCDSNGVCTEEGEFQHGKCLAKREGSKIVPVTCCSFSIDMNTGIDSIKNSHCIESGLTRMHIAAQDGDVKRIQELDQNLIHNTTSSGLTPFHFALLSDEPEAAKHLYYEQTDRDKSISCPLVEAMVRYSYDLDDLHKTVEAAGIPISLLKKVIKDSSCLLYHLAAQVNNTDALRWLFHNYPEKIDAQSPDNKLNPLHTAVAYGSLEAVQTIHHQDPSLIREITASGLSALDLAVLNDRAETIRYLRRKAPELFNKSSSGDLLLHNAAHHGAANAVKVLLEISPKSISDKINGQTPLHYAIANDKAECVKVLLDHGATHFPDKNPSVSSLFVAAYFNALESAKLLHSIDPTLIEITDEDGYTPMHAAAMHDSLEVARWLATVDPSLRKKKTGFFGSTPYDIAQAHNSKKMKEWLEHFML